MTIPNDVALPQVNVLGSTMAYREAGDHDAPVALFLHGNPTSSYVWRNVLPHVALVAHCVAPDLVGFGQSGKPNIEYRVADHVRYLDEFLDHAKIDSAFVVAQDWGTELRFPRPSLGDPPGDFRTRSRSRVSLRMCIQVLKKHTKFWRNRPTPSCYSRETLARLCRQLWLRVSSKN